MGRDDPSGSIPSYGDLISIHSPRMGRDPGRSRSPRMISRFQSTLPAWGETAARRWTGRGMPFQSTLPAWGETDHHRRDRDGQSGFQSTLPAWGETKASAERRGIAEISIHSPRMGRDMGVNTAMLGGSRFQSTLPAWGETNKDDTLLLRRAISIHSPRMGRDSGSPSGPARHEDFNPLSPHGERLDYACMAEKWEPFQSTLPAWGETPLSR